jgi:hypothetical protein
MKTRKQKKVSSADALAAKIAGELKRASNAEVAAERKKHGRKAA